MGVVDSQMEATKYIQLKKEEIKIKIKRTKVGY